MKKLGLFFTLFCFYAIYALFIAVPPASAVGQQCCTGATYNSSQNQCEFLNYSGTTGGSISTYKNTKCGSSEACNPNTNTCISSVEAQSLGIVTPGGATTPTCDNGNGTPTALGCIPNQPAEAIKLILPWAIRLGTGLAFLLFLYGAFTLITAGSDPQKVDTGKSIITSAAAGLIFIILSVILLRVIGIDILQL